MLIRGHCLRAALLALSTALPLALLAPTPANANDGALWHPWFEIGGYYNTDDASRGEVTVFAPLSQSHNSLAFVDLRGKFFEEDVKEGNFALGYRQMAGFGFNLGAWIGGDVRHTALENTFWQLSGGFEALSENFDARVNWYGPVSNPQLANDLSFTQVSVSGDSIFMIGGEEVALMGVDGELGVRLPVEVLNIDPRLVEFRIYGGGFYFDHEDALEEIAGGKVRVELALNDILPELPGSKLTAEYEYSYDSVRENRHEVGARLRIPFGKSGTTRALQSLTGQQRRMLVRIERDTDIVTAQSEREAVEDVLTGTDFDRVALVGAGGSITNTSTAAGDNSLIIVNGTVNAGTQTVGANQTVQGGGSTIQVRGRKTGAVAGFTASGASGSITNGAGAVLALQGDNTHIAGLTIDGLGTSTFGVSGGSGRTNIALTQNTIQNAGTDGINFDDNNNRILIAESTVLNAGSEGVVFDDFNQNVTIANTTITNAGSEGIFLNDENSNITILNVTVAGAGQEGIEFDDRNTNVTISGTAISNTGNDAIRFEDFNRNVTIANTTVTNAGSEGIFLNDDNSNIVLSGLTISGTNRDGIELDQRNTNVSITGSSLTGIGSVGINLDDTNQNVTVSGNSISSGGFGIQLDDGNSNVSILNNTVVAGNDAINFGGLNTAAGRNSNVVISGNMLTAGAAGEGIQFATGNQNIAITNNVINAGDEGIQFDNDNTGLTITGNTIVSATEDGIELDDDNSGTISGNTITATAGDGINFNNGNTFSVLNNAFGTIGDDAIRVRANNTVTISNNLFNGPIGGQLLDVDNTGSVLSGTGNISNVAVTCESGTFAGTVEVSGIILQDGVAPCN